MRRRPTITMADIGNAIEALKIAIADRKSFIESNLPPSRKNWSEEDRADYKEWNDELKRFRALRKKLLTIEKAA